ncbi:MAG: hypothetical protein LQ351_002244 [Letrouitia transgressa]|nr:MAG: hypothetical protein LQ351_002244 [Letrouitia transgressa]
MEIIISDQPLDVAQPLFKKRSAKKSSAVRKRPATPPPADTDGSSEYSSASDEEGRTIKKQRRTGGVIAGSANVAKPSPAGGLESTNHVADRSSRIEATNDATKQSNWFDESKMNPASLLGTTRPRPTPSSETEPDGSYKGAASYQSFIQKNPNAPSRQVGPVKAPTNIRTITVTDFAPDVCKDYKLTGQCGFGSSCKFLHAREDYKQGWELDKDWEISTKGKKLKGTNVTAENRKKGDDESDEEDSVLEGIPFACIICKKAYTNPVVTKCGHYFCETCALQRYKKNPSCPTCGAGTGGVFNGAKSLKKLLERKRERARKRREKAMENGEEASEGEEENEEG